MGANKSRESRSPVKPKKSKRDLDLSICPARVDKVNISGLRRTKDDYVQRVAERLFKAKTFQDVLLECNRATNYINDLGIYKDVRVHIDISRGEKATPNGYEITFTGNEYARILGAVGTEVGHNEGSLTTEITTPNIWGRGEKLSLQGSLSNSKTSDVTLRLSKPFFHTIFGEHRPEASIGIFRHSNSNPVCAYKTNNVGLLGEMTFILPLALQIVHSFQYELAFREISTLGKQSPFFVRENCGPRMASVVRHIASYDQRDSSVFPSRGIHLKTTAEFSGLGGNISYLMGYTHAEINRPLFGGISVQLCSRIGFMKDYDKNTPEPPIASLFTIGGPLSLRGFKFAGVGPHIDSCPLGVYSYWTGGLHLWAPLPFNSYLGRFGNLFRTHLFYNVGDCKVFSTETLRTAAGIGLAIRLGERARIEFNYCYPLNKQSGDKPQKGFQFGIGYEFI